MLGQPSRGLMRRSRARPKFAITRAVAPMFSPSCGSTRTMIGPGVSIQFLVLSVPAPGMSVHQHVVGLRARPERSDRRGLVATPEAVDGGVMAPQELDQLLPGLRGVAAPAAHRP